MPTSDTKPSEAEKLVETWIEKYAEFSTVDPDAAADLMNQIDSALTTTRAEALSEGMARAADICRSIVAEDKEEYEAEKGTGFIGSSYEYAGSRECLEAILAASPDPNYRDRIRDGAYEAAACICDALQQRHITYAQVSSIRADADAYKCYAAGAEECAASIRALKSQQGKG